VSLKADWHGHVDEGLYGLIRIETNEDDT